MGKGARSVPLQPVLQRKISDDLRVLCERRCAITVGERERERRGGSVLARAVFRRLRKTSWTGGGRFKRLRRGIRDAGSHPAHRRGRHRQVVPGLGHADQRQRAPVIFELALNVVVTVVDLGSNLFRGQFGDRPPSPPTNPTLRRPSSQMRACVACVIICTVYACAPVCTAVP